MCNWSSRRKFHYDQLNWCHSASEDSQAVQEDAMKDEEEEEVDSEEDGDSLQKAKQALTGRGVTLSDLMNDGLIHAGQNVLSIDYRVSSKWLSKTLPICLQYLMKRSVSSVCLSLLSISSLNSSLNTNN